MFSSFNLTLMVQHACNLRCSYCYTGSKFSKAMPAEIGKAATGRAVNSLKPGGTLELSFFGGEPLLEAELILHLIDEARRQVESNDLHLQLSLTTNGTLASGAAWEVMGLDDMLLHVSHDGLPDVHDRHRVGPSGEPSSALVAGTIRRLLEAGREVRVSMVVRPSTVESFTAGIRWLKNLGVSHVDPTLDLWADWTHRDAQNLDAAITECADLWFDSLPEFGIGWFNEKLAALVPARTQTARCGFGRGQIAVSPAGNLYPCERVIGEDRADNRMRLNGSASDGDDFCHMEISQRRPPDTCLDCAILDQCNTFCRCSNYIRTNDVNTPDGLLCLLDQACYRETQRVVKRGAMSSNSQASPVAPPAGAYPLSQATFDKE